MLMMKWSLIFLQVQKETVTTGETDELHLHTWYILIICSLCKIVIERIIAKQGFCLFLSLIFFALKHCSHSSSLTRIFVENSHSNFSIKIFNSVCMADETVDGLPYSLQGNAGLMPVNRPQLASFQVCGLSVQPLSAEVHPRCPQKENYCYLSSLS